MSRYKNIYTFEKRLKDSRLILNTYPNRIPIICDRYGQNVPDLDKKKYLAPEDLTLGQFIFVIRRRLKFSPQNALFVYINNKLLSTNMTLYTIYKEHKDPDGFLYMVYTSENVFG